MNKKFTALVLVAATWVVFLPASSAAYSSGEKNNLSALIPNENLILQQRRGRGGRNGRYWEPRGRRRNGNWYGYRNYGQYRRTQVGNRRYRMVRRSYWRDGRRYYIWRRIFY
jgi:hypothetical protein